MNPNFPLYPSIFKRYPNYNSHYYTQPKFENSIINPEIYESNANYEEKKQDRKVSDTSEFFEIFGLKLYFDDILLICLIFFLYSEGVKDDMLFIALILLLLS